MILQASTHIFTILSSRTVNDSQAARYEVILYIHHHQGRPGLHDLQHHGELHDVSQEPGLYLGYPAIPAVNKLLFTHAPITRHVEDHEQVTHQLAVHLVGLAILIPEEGGADGGELVDVDGLVPAHNDCH